MPQICPTLSLAATGKVKTLCAGHQTEAGHDQTFFAPHFVDPIPDTLSQQHDADGDAVLFATGARACPLLGRTQ